MSVCPSVSSIEKQRESQRDYQMLKKVTKATFHTTHYHETRAHVLKQNRGIWWIITGAFVVENFSFLNPSHKNTMIIWNKKI